MAAFDDRPFGRVRSDEQTIRGRSRGAGNAAVVGVRRRVGEGRAGDVGGAPVADQRALPGRAGEVRQVTVGKLFGGPLDVPKPDFVDQPREVIAVGIGRTDIGAAGKDVLVDAGDGLDELAVDV